MPITISENGEFEFLVTASPFKSGQQKGSFDFYVDVGDTLITKTFAFTLEVVEN